MSERVTLAGTTTPAYERPANPPTPASVQASERVRVAALRASIEMGGRDLRLVLRRAEVIAEWIAGAPAHTMSIPNDLRV